MYLFSDAKHMLAVPLDKNLVEAHGVVTAVDQ